MPVRMEKRSGINTNRSGSAACALPSNELPSFCQHSRPSVRATRGRNANKHQHPPPRAKEL